MAYGSASSQRYFEETRDVSPGNLLIKVEDFSLFSKHEIHKLESRTFEAGSIKWKLMIYPEGCESEKEDCHVSVQLAVAETDSLPEGWEVNAVFAFFVYNHFMDNYLCFRGTTRRFNSLVPKWGFSKLMSKKSLMDPSKVYLVEDSCLFGAEVFVVKSERVSECLSLMKATSSSRRDWKISDFSKLESVWSSEEFELGDQKWKVAVHPKGYSASEKGRYVSIFVECVAAKSFAPHQKVKAEVFIRIKHKLDNTHHTRKYNHWFESSSPDWGFREFISISDMSSKGLLVDDCCFLEIEIFVQALVLDDAPKSSTPSSVFVD